MRSWRAGGALMMAVTLVTGAAAASPAALAPPAPALGGAWEGALVSGALRLVLRIDHTSGGWTAAIDSLDQGAHDIPASTVKVAGDELEVRFHGLDAAYVAKIGGDALRGTCRTVPGRRERERPVAAPSVLQQPHRLRAEPRDRCHPFMAPMIDRR